MFFRRTPSFSFLRPFRPDVPGKELFLVEQDLQRGRAFEELKDRSSGLDDTRESLVSRGTG